MVFCENRKEGNAQSKRKQLIKVISDTSDLDRGANL